MILKTVDLLWCRLQTQNEVYDSVRILSWTQAGAETGNEDTELAQTWPPAALSQLFSNAGRVSGRSQPVQIDIGEKLFWTSLTLVLLCY